MILKALLAITLTSFVYAENEVDDIKKLMELMKKNQIAMEEMNEAEDLVEEDPEDIYFPDDSYIGLKCIRDRDSLAYSSSYTDAGYWDLNKKDDFGKHYHKPYVNHTYLTISPSQKKGMIVYGFIYFRNIDTDMYQFYGEDYFEKAPYESTKFIVNDNSYVVDFRESLEVSFNREDLSFSFTDLFYSSPKRIHGSCQIMNSIDFFEDIESRNEKVNKLKERNQEKEEANKPKLKF